jgi:hypothetical protein
MLQCPSVCNTKPTDETFNLTKNHLKAKQSSISVKIKFDAGLVDKGQHTLQGMWGLHAYTSLNIQVHAVQ